jgi:uncharacterized membrane protein YcaP (DUF421 family)
MQGLGIIVRIGTTYVFLLLLLRLAGKRTIGGATPFDLVVALVLGDFPDDVIWGEVPVAQGIVAFGTIMTLHLAVAYASYRSVRVDRLVSGSPTVVVRHGRRLRQGMAAVRMNEPDLDVQLRLHGRARLTDVAEAIVEPNGRLSLRPTPAAQTAQRRDLSSRSAA